MLRILEQSHGMKKNLHKVETYLEQYLTFDDPYISESARYALNSGGKRVRPALVMMTATLFDQAEEAIPLAAAMELIHMSSLIHDDIVDGSATRRGKPSLNAAHGQGYALHTGDYILTKAIEIIKNQPNSHRLMEVMADLSIEMCLGEVEQLRTMYDTAQTIADYNYRIDRKTALLMATSCQAGALVCSASEELVNIFYRIGYNLGMAFQIRDDILDFEKDERKLGKPAGEDLARGIMTLPTILVLQKDFPERQWLLETIQNRFVGGKHEVKQAIALIKAQNGLKDAHAYAVNYVQQAKQDIQQLPEHAVQRLLLSGADYIIERSF